MHPHEHHIYIVLFDRLKPYVERMLQKEGTGDAQRDDTLGGRGLALDMMVLQ